MKNEELVDRKVLEHLKYVSDTERKTLLSLVDTARTNPDRLLILAIFRDVYVTQQMTKSYILRLESRINEVESELESTKKSFKKIY